MSDPGEDKVLLVLEGTAKENFALATDGDTNDSARDPLALEVDRYCSCPSARTASVDCTSSCPGPVPPFVFYRLNAAKNYSGILIPALGLGRELDVQIR